MKYLTAFGSKIRNNFTILVMLVPTNINGIVKLLRILDPKAVRYSYGKWNIVPRGFARRLSKMRGSRIREYSPRMYTRQGSVLIFVLFSGDTHFGCFMLFVLAWSVSSHRWKGKTRECWDITTKVKTKNVIWEYPEF